MIHLLVFWLWFRRQPVGTRSLLLGGHQFVIHPVSVAIAWRRIYGHWPITLPYYVAFLVHDWGYWGCPDMDGPRGKEHPERGAQIMFRLFDPHCQEIDSPDAISWYEWTGCHSRAWAKLFMRDPSTLAAPDKLATRQIPTLLLALLYALSGEWREYKTRWLEHTDPPYAGTKDDNVLQFTRHLRAEWERFERPGADLGTPFS